MFELIRKLIDLFDRPSLVGLALLMIPFTVIALLETLSIGAVLPLLQVMDDPKRLEVLPVFGDRLAELYRTGPDTFVIYLCGFIAGVFALKNILFVGLMFGQNLYVARLLTRFMRRLYLTFLDKPYIEFTASNSANTQRDVIMATATTFMSGVLPVLYVLLEGLTVLAIGILLVAHDPLPAVAAAGILGLGSAALHLVLAPHIAYWGERTNDLSADLLRTVAETSNGIKDIKLSKVEPYFVRRFQEIAADANVYRCYGHSYLVLPRAVIEILMVLAITVIVWVYVANGATIEAIIPVLGLYGLAALRLLPSLNRIMQHVSRIRFAGGAITTLHNHLSAEGLLRTAAAGRPDRAPGPTGHPDGPGDDTDELIALRDVSFSYPDRSQPAVHDINFSISRYQTVGIAGPSGAGKSTLANLLLGLLTPDGGEIRIAGHAAGGGPEGLAALIGHVPQQIFLRDDTITRNIAFGIDDSEIDEDAVELAIRRSQLQSFLEQLPDGLQSRAGEHGIQLSGGQKQRIGIARALYHDPQILVFDEATSSLDGETELAIEQTIRDLSQRKTILIIAHRLSTIRQCDLLLFMRDGRLQSSGTYRELLSKDADFRSFVEAYEREAI